MIHSNQAAFNAAFEWFQHPKTVAAEIGAFSRSLSILPQYFRNTPNMIGNVRFHRGRHAERAVDLAEVVIGEVKGNRGLVILVFLTEGIR